MEQTAWAIQTSTAVSTPRTDAFDLHSDSFFCNPFWLLSVFLDDHWIGKPSEDGTRKRKGLKTRSREKDSRVLNLKTISKS